MPGRVYAVLITKQATHLSKKNWSELDELETLRKDHACLWSPVLVKIVILKLPHKSVFSATVVLFISLLCNNFYRRYIFF